MLKKVKIYPDMKFNEWCLYWLEHTNYSRSITTHAKYEEIILRVIKPAFENKILSELKYQDIQGFIDILNIKGLRAARISMIRSVLKMILECAANHNLISRNPASLAQSTKRNFKFSAVLNDEDIKKLILIKDDSRYIPVILLTLFLGLRIGECLGLSWNNIDMEKGNVNISQQFVSYYKDGKTIQSLLPYTKTRKNRILPLPEVAKELLEAQRKIYVANHDNLVFTEDDGSPILYAAFYYRFNQIMDKIGRPDITPHSLRHTAATTLLYNTKDILLVKEMLGHTSVKTTGRYPTASLQERIKTAKAIDDYFASYMEALIKC